MNYNRFISLILFLLLLGISNISSQQRKSNPMTKAVIDVYNKLLQEDPKDYETYFHRANEFYKQNLYMRALSDIDNAIKYTPETETDMLIQEYSLRANIYMMTDRKEDALKDMTSAVLLNPTDYVLCYQKANLDYELGNYSDAKEGYRRMQRLNSRSVEALVGLARVAIKENNLGLANDFINKAVEFDQTNSNVYVRRASIRKEMGNNSGCVEDLLIAISLDNNNSKAFKDLNEMANTDYRAVVSGISNVISQVPEQGMYYYIRGYIAMDHYHYTSALSDFKYLLEHNIYNYDGIYRSIALCYMNLAEYENALDNIEVAISMSADNSKSYQVKAQILNAMGNYSKALEHIEKSIEGSEENETNMTIKGRILINMENYIDASSAFGAASMYNPTNPEPYLWRGYTLKNYLFSQESAKTFYNRVAEADISELGIHSYKGFALLEVGERAKAEEWMQEMLSKPDNDGEINYYAACFYSLAGDEEKALEAVRTSVSKGFGSIYLWKDYSEGVINVSNLRDNDSFKEIISALSVK